MPRPGINQVLFDTVVAQPPAWLSGLGKNAECRDIDFLPTIGAEIDAFLSATTDSGRLVAASAASRAILKQHEIDELEELREFIQLSELIRIIPYGRQTDHSAHTLYLYLLGLFFIYRSDRIRSGLIGALELPDKAAAGIDRLYCQWAFASLLHDVGYIFQADAERQQIVHRMFRASTILRRLSGESSEENDLRLEIRKKVLEKGWSPTFTAAATPEDLLDSLRRQPWGLELGGFRDAFDTFHYMGPKKGLNALQLEEYAYLVASTGYDGVSRGTVDHAVGGGLFLLAYSTYWAWLAKESGFRGSFSIYPQSYEMRDIVNSCFAVAAHNVIGVHGARVAPLQFDDNPLLYLSVLCDELQKWDRFPAGVSFLADLRSFAKHCTDSEQLQVTEDADGRFVFTYPSAELAKQVRKGLTRLSQWEAFIDVRNAP